MTAQSESPPQDGIRHIDPEAETTTKETENLQDFQNGQQEYQSPSSCEVASDLQQHPGKTAPSMSTCKTITQWILWFLKDQWFLLAMCAIILVSSQVQVPASQQKIKRTVITYLSVSVIFFINGCTLPTRLLIENYMRWKLHFFVQLQCYLVCSAATFAMVSLCATNPKFMDPWLLIGFLFVGSAPTTMSSNVVMTRQAHGNTALTVVQSVIGQFLCPFLSPVIVQMYLSSGAWYSQVLEKGSGYGEIYRRVFMQLGLSLFLPMAVGQAVQYFFGRTCKKVFVDWKLTKLSSLALLTLVWQTFDQAFQNKAFESVKKSNIIFIVFICATLYFLWTALCFTASIVWLPKKDVIACCYCCPAKALAMVVPLTSVMYINISPLEQSKMQIPAIIFQAFQVGMGGLMTIAFRRWIRSEEEREEAERGDAAPAGEAKC
ncbi:SBF-like CPA transporter family-domain-containing protein [Boeremia exigua]|uniref:SBF-like CPA transporter family-domain-containing protein n=1 Tax=Boeremia exigua TaxID=749465 RepID=UPI001E8E22D2|nr:SBF-like CPA transporter family-domain-containing protein [Boeremia exigua]KAH6620505.1 SBF-like CPA transporter family-domain-containing protein [Boeremia exigua]